MVVHVDILAAAKTMLIMSDLLKPETKLLKKSIVTELAKSSSQLDSAASTDYVSCLPMTKPFKKSIATERATSSSQLDPAVSTDDVSRLPSTVALEVILKQSNAEAGGIIGSLATACVAKLSGPIHIMMMHKDGSPKNPNATLGFMMRVANVREHLRASSSDNATEHVELYKEEVSMYYQRFGRILLADDLLQHQRKDERYCLRDDVKGDTYLSTIQRSFVNNLIR